MNIARAYLIAAGLFAAGSACLTYSAPARADVKAGVDAWVAGNDGAAVREWREPAAQGDPDAQFNMAQAFRLGRGVDKNIGQAEVFYRKAAEQGHIKAADNYGLLLFQNGRREMAMPYLSAAADRGDPRAQYLIGIAHFNGDLLPRDWVRAYALLTLSNASGLPQAAPALGKMDEFIPREEREQAQNLAQTLKRDADANRAAQMAAADLLAANNATAAVSPPVIAAASTTVLPGRAASLPRPVQSVTLPPSVAGAQTAVSEAARATGMESPASAGADYVQHRAQPKRPVYVDKPAAQDSAPRSAQSSPPPQPGYGAQSGPWKIQLGAFSVARNADKLWDQLSSRSQLAGRRKLLFQVGGLTKLMAGGFASQAEAARACQALKTSGHACLVRK